MQRGWKGGVGWITHKDCTEFSRMTTAGVDSGGTD